MGALGMKPTSKTKKGARKCPEKSETLLSSSKKHYGPGELPHHNSVSKKRRRAPVASDNLESEYIADLKHCVEDEVEDEDIIKDEVEDEDIIVTSSKDGAATKDG